MQTETTRIEASPKRLIYTVQEAIHADQLDEVYKLRYEVYSEEYKKFNKAAFSVSDEKLNDRFDKCKGTINLLARSNGNYIGTIRATIIENSEQELPCDQYHKEYIKLRSKLKGKFSSVSMLAIKKPNCSISLLYTLIKDTIKIGNDRKVDYALFPVSYKLQSTLERLGASLVGEIKYNEQIGTYIAPMMLEIKRVAQRLDIKGYYFENAA